MRTRVLGLLLLLVGLMAVPFFRDVIGRLFLYALVGGGVVLLVLFVIVGSMLLVFRGN